MLSRAPDPTPLHDDLWVPLEANFPALPVGALPLTPLLLWIGARPRALRISIVTSLFLGVELRIFVLL